jgi:hypothetical protein
MDRPNLQCQSCAYYNPIDHQCRRGPPTILTRPDKRGGVGINSIWPPVALDYWCGHHSEWAKPIVAP